MVVGCCIVDIDFLYNTANDVFAKNISICGVTAPNKKMYSKIISYPYPSTDQLCDDIDNISGCTRRKYGNLTYPLIDVELYKALQPFDVVVVNGFKQKDFISHYTSHRAIVINTEEQQTGHDTTDNCYPVITSE